jgi:hypothetical protein
MRRGTGAPARHTSPTILRGGLAEQTRRAPPNGSASAHPGGNRCAASADVCGSLIPVRRNGCAGHACAAAQPARSSRPAVPAEQICRGTGAPCPPVPVLGGTDAPRNRYAAPAAVRATPPAEGVYKEERICRALTRRAALSTMHPGREREET